VKKWPTILSDDNLFSGSSDFFSPPLEEREWGDLKVVLKAIDLAGSRKPIRP